MKVIWSDLAVEDLRNIESYIAEDNPERAVSFILELIDLGDSLIHSDTVKKGTPAKWISNPNVRELYYYQYIIIYEVCEDTVFIHEVYNSAKRPRH